MLLDWVWEEPWHLQNDNAHLWMLHHQIDYGHGSLRLSHTGSLSNSTDPTLKSDGACAKNNCCLPGSLHYHGVSCLGLCIISAWVSAINLPGRSWKHPGSSTIDPKQIQTLSNHQNEVLGSEMRCLRRSWGNGLILRLTYDHTWYILLNLVDLVLNLAIELSFWVSMSWRSWEKDKPRNSCTNNR